MHLLIAYQGHYGKRITAHIRQHKPADWKIETITLPPVLPVLIDDPTEFLPDSIKRANLVLGLCENEGAAQLIPGLAIKSGAKAVIMPIDNAKWITQGLKNQLKNEMAKYPQVLINVRTTEKVDLDNHQQLNAMIQEVEAQLGDEGRVLIRASGTEPLIRVMVEAKDAQLTQQSAEKLANTLR